MSKQIYVRAVVPDYAQKDFCQKRYSAFYVGHADESALLQATLEARYREWLSLDHENYSPEILDFMDWLESEHKYVVFDSTHDGFVVLPVNANLPQQGT